MENNEFQSGAIDLSGQILAAFEVSRQRLADSILRLHSERTERYKSVLSQGRVDVTTVIWRAENEEGTVLHLIDSNNLTSMEPDPM